LGRPALLREERPVDKEEEDDRTNPSRFEELPQHEEVRSALRSGLTVHHTSCSIQYR
jgi:hypothetical protein